MARGTRKKRRRTRTGLWLIVGVFVSGFMLHSLGILARPVRLINQYNVNYVIVDLNKGKYRVSPIVATNPDHCEDFTSMVNRTKPYAAICGTYYDPDYKPLGDILINGKLVNRGCQRQAIGFTADGKIKFLERKGKSRINWSGCLSGIACGPRLVRGRCKDINVKRDGFGSKATTNEAFRCAVGAKKDGKLILCVIKNSVTLNTAAEIMIELGAVDAINLDGGSMCALYENGKYHARPVHAVSNILAVYKRK